MEQYSRTGSEVIEVLRRAVAAVEKHCGTVQAVQYQETHCNCPATITIACRLLTWESALRIFDTLSVDVNSVEVQAPEGSHARLYIGNTRPEVIRYAMAAFADTE